MYGHSIAFGIDVKQFEICIIAIMTAQLWSQIQSVLAEAKPRNSLIVIRFKLCTLIIVCFKCTVVNEPCAQVEIS